MTQLRVPTSSKMNAVLLSEYGGSENLSWGETDLPSGPKDGHIMIQVIAAGVNRPDIIQRKGDYPPPTGESEILGLEVSGYVVKCGNNSSKFKIGDRVFALLPGGGYAQYATVDERLTMAIPQNMEFKTATAIPENWLTGFQLLHLEAKGFLDYLKGKQDTSALVHAGASGVGTALIQLTRDLGMKCYVTAGSAEKIDYCLALGATSGTNYKIHPKWDEELAHHEPKGVDIILDSVGASYFGQNMKSLKTDGYYVLYGTLGGSKLDGENLGWILRKRLNVFGSTLKSRSMGYKSSLVNKFEHEVVPKFESGQFKVSIYEEFSAVDVKKAHDMMESNKNMGKIVLAITE